VLAIGEDFREQGIEAVAICFLNSYRNPENERRALDAFAAAFPDIWVTASISVLPEIREYERTSTTVVNAYVLPALRRYFTQLEEGLRDIGVGRAFAHLQFERRPSRGQARARKTGLLHLLRALRGRHRRSAAR
jgi:N-methylhydantoinase A/oxoprolinase/acetone carboxylase beta subunit